MKNFGFVKVGSAVPRVTVADVEKNVEQIMNIIDQAVAHGVEILCFPELCITGYSCQDLFRSTVLLDKADAALDRLSAFCRKKPIVVIVGSPVRNANRLFNSAVVIAADTRFVVNKTFLPNYAEFYEKRWFVAEDCHAKPLVFELPSGVKFSIELCEDLFSPLPPSTFASLMGVDLIFNLSATTELTTKHDYLLSLLSQQSARCMSGYVYSSAGFGESTGDVVYGGNALIYENGQCLAQSKRFSLEPQLVVAQIDVERLRSERLGNTTFSSAQSEVDDGNGYIPLEVELPSKFSLERNYDPHPFIPKERDMQASSYEIFNIQVLGLAKRLSHIQSKNVVIGISGGLDSTLAVLVCAATFDLLGLDRKGIVGITMPGFGTSSRTYDNALQLSSELHISLREIPIASAVEQHFKDIGHDEALHDVTYENSQARYRTMVLMDVANKISGIVVGTGDLSELALGWCTYNGDHMSMYAVNMGIPKTLVKYLIKYVAQETANENTRNILLDIINTPISPELIPTNEEGTIAQKTEDIIGPYELHDFFLYHFMRFGFSPEKILLLACKAFDGSNGVAYDKDTIRHYLRVFFKRFFSQQFKRSCLPDGPKVGSVSLSPRGDWRMPSDASVEAWLSDSC